MDVFRSLQIVDMAGRPTIGDSCRPWMLDFAEAVFGSYDPETGRRLIREFFLLVSKKNTKSTIAAGIMMTALIRNWRDEAEFIILAPTIEVANNSFKPAAAMIRADTELDAKQGGLLHIQDHVRTITHLTTGATLKVVAADTSTVGGKKAVGVLIDELWLFGENPHAEDMFREATGGLASKPEGFVIELSTQSSKPPAGIFKQKVDRFRDIRDGKIVDRKSLGVLYEFPAAMVEAKQHLEPSNFYVTNPNLGASVDEEWLQDEFTKSQEAGPATLQGFAAKHLNIEIGVGLIGNRWQGAKYWERRATSRVTKLEDLFDFCDVITLGADGGGLDDLFGLGAIGREKVTRRWFSWSHAWVHEGVLNDRQKIAPRLRDFEAEGSLTIVGDELKDLKDIVDHVRRVRDSGLLGGVGVDPAGIGEFVDELALIDVTLENDLLVGITQGVKLMQAIKGVERKLANGTLQHAGSGMMNWCVGNVRIEPMATAIRATKAHAGDAKIDPVMALFNAAMLMQLDPEPQNSGSMEGFFASLKRGENGRAPNPPR